MHFRIIIGIAFITSFSSCKEAGNNTQGVLQNPTSDADPLPSWNEGNVKSAIIEYVEDVTNSENPNFIDVADRIATFDNDGNLWSEQPMYFQLFFAIERVNIPAPEHPE